MIISDEWANTGWVKIFHRFVEDYNKAYPEGTLLDTKEKYGELRVYTDPPDIRLEAEASWRSRWTCIKCGKQPKENNKHVVYSFYGMPLCKECAMDDDTKKLVLDKDFEYSEFNDEILVTWKAKWEDNDEFSYTVKH